MRRMLLIAASVVIQLLAQPVLGAPVAQKDEAAVACRSTQALLQGGNDAAQALYKQDQSVDEFDGDHAVALAVALAHWADDGRPQDATHDLAHDLMEAVSIDTVYHAYIAAPTSDAKQIPGYMIVSRDGCVLEVYVATGDYFDKFIKRHLDDPRSAIDGGEHNG